MLSVNENTKILCDSLIDGHDFSCVLSRKEFEELNSEPFNRCMNTVKAVLKDLLLVDVKTILLGIELNGKIFSTVVPRNTAVPCTRTKTYTTMADNQTEIDVVVYEGERTSTDACNKLGQFMISGIERAKRG